MPHIKVSYPHAGRQTGDVVYVSSAEAARRVKDGVAAVVPSPRPERKPAAPAASATKKPTPPAKKTDSD